MSPGNHCWVKHRSIRNELVNIKQVVSFFFFLACSLSITLCFLFFFFSYFYTFLTYVGVTGMTLFYRWGHWDSRRSIGISFRLMAPVKINTNLMLKTTEIYTLTVQKPEVQNQGINRAMLPPEVWGEVPFPGSSSFWWLLVSSGLRPHHSSASMVTTPFCPCVSNFPLPSLIRILVIEFRAPWDNPG